MRAALDVGWLEQLFIRLGLMPARGVDQVARTGWGLGLATSVSRGVTKWQTHTRLGYFAPLDAKGRYISPTSLSRWQTALLSTDPKNWKDHRRMGNTRATWLKADKVVGRVAWPVTFATSAYGQYQEDAADASLSGAERAARVTTVGGATAAGAWGGAALGASIGSVVPGVGTVVGGVVGGVIGGVAGSELGGFTKDWAGDRADDVWGAAKDVGGAVKDAGSQVKFW